jgi:phage terminase small subunit
MALTIKQEAFAQAVASGKSQADAYRAAYSADKMKPETVQNKAHVLMKDGEVTARVAELRKPVVLAAQITLASHLDRLQALSAAAETSSQFSAAIAAEVARGKASGLYVEKTELSGPGGAPVDINHTISFVTPHGKG